MSTPTTPPSSGGTSESSLIRDLATALVPPASTFDSSTLRKGRVVAFNYEGGNAYITVTLSGSTVEIPNIACLSTYSPHVNDVCILMKQGNGLLAVGSVWSDGGWQNASLQSGWTNNGNDQGTLQYRIIQEHGGAKVQWRGGVNKTGSNATICNVPEIYRPYALRRTVVAPRNANGNNDVKLDFEVSGNVNTVGETTGSHSHYVDITDNEHNHGGSTTMTALTIRGWSNSWTPNEPEWIGFNGVQYFL